MPAVSEATGAGSEGMTAKSETSGIGREKGRCRLPLLARLPYAKAADREAKTATTSARIRLLGARAGLKMDRDHHAASSPNALLLKDSQQPLKWTTSGARG
jgi:hypothetical protein